MSHLCLSPFFLSRFKVCPHITLLSYACVQKSTCTHPRPLFTNTAAPFSQPSRCECPLVRVLLPVKSLFFFFYQPPSQALNRQRKSREFGSRRDKIKLKQWGGGWGGGILVQHGINSPALGAPGVTFGGRGQVTLKQLSWVYPMQRIHHV